MSEILRVLERTNVFVTVAVVSIGSALYLSPSVAGAMVIVGGGTYAAAAIARASK